MNESSNICFHMEPASRSQDSARDVFESIRRYLYPAQSPKLYHMRLSDSSTKQMACFANLLNIKYITRTLAKQKQLLCRNVPENNKISIPSCTYILLSFIAVGICQVCVHSFVMLFKKKKSITLGLRIHK